MGARRRLVRRMMCGVALVAPVEAFGAQAEPAPGPVAVGEPPPGLSEPTTSAAPDPAPEAGAIIITGSRIPRQHLTAVSPVTMIRKDEVQFQGAIMAEELLDQLPQIAPSQGAFISNDATGTATVDLRNLGASRTLVLINGRRLGPGDARQPVADINIIPTTLIQRVEVLTGGATSVYGSDAVSGVVNFILDDRFEGFRIDAQASVFQHDNRNDSGLRSALDARGLSYPTGSTIGGGRQDINVALGGGLFDDRLHVSFYAGYRKLSPLTQDQRDYSACSADVFRQDNTVLVCGGSPTSYPGTFATNYGPLIVGPDRTFEPGFIPFNFGPWNYYQRPGRRITAGLFADAEIAPSFKPYLEIMTLDDKSTAQIAPSGAFFNTDSINCDNPLLSPQQLSLLCIDGNFVGQNVFDGEIIGEPVPFTDPVTGATYYKANLFLGRRAVESGGRQDVLTHKTIRALAGTKGDLGRGLSYDASYLYSRNRLVDEHLNDFSVSRLVKALDVVRDPGTGQPVCRAVLTGADPNCIPWDIFALGGVTPEANAYLAVPSFIRGTVTQRVANANVTLQLGEWGIRSPWADESPAVNFGAEYRKDRLDVVPDELAQSGELAGTTPIVPVSGSIDVKELFAEARIPLIAGRLVEQLAFEGGYRRSWYRAKGSSYPTEAYKLALDLTAVRGLRFRASHQRAVRAPNVVELFSAPETDFFFHDPCEGAAPLGSAAQCANSGVSADQYGQIIPVPNPNFFVYNAIRGGNSELEPEVARTRTLGVVVEPRFLPGFNATVDWWDIRLDRAISYVGGDDIIDNCIFAGDPLFCSRIHRDANGSLWMTPEGFIDTKLLNIGSLRVSGIDIGASYRRDLGRVGAASLQFLGTWLDKATIDKGGLSTPIDCAGKFGYVCQNPYPRWRHKARLTWEAPGGLSLSLHWRHIGKMSIEPILTLPPPGPLSSRLPARSFFDLAALFRVQRRYALRIGVNNIFDREPPIVPAGEGAGGSYGYNGNTFPQWYDPLGRYLFAGVTVTF